MMRSLFARGLVAVTLLGAGATVAAAATTHVRGEVTAISGDVATVRTVPGDMVAVTLKPDFGLIVYHRIALSDLKPDDYLSIPSVKASDGGKQAVTIGVFPAALRGVGEGESDWDLGPDSRMTNAAFATQGADHTITINYKGRQETVEVPEGTPIMSFAPAPDRKLAVGDKAIFFATDTDGTLVSTRAGVMEDGSAPPM
jgi:hypothetical protein